MSAPRDRDLYAEVTALKALLGAILAALANRDPDLVRDIVATCDSVLRPRPDIPIIDPATSAVAVELNNLLQHLRDTLTAE